MICLSAENKKRLSAMPGKSLSFANGGSYLKKTGSSPPMRQSAVILWVTEAVALAPPCTHAGHCFHTFLLNILLMVILPDSVNL